MIGIKAQRVRFSVGHFVDAGVLRRHSLWSVEIRVGIAAAAAAQQPAHVPPEGTSEDGVQEGVAEGVDGVKENQQDFGVGHGYEGHAQRGRDGKEGDWRHAHEVCEYEHGHALGDLGVAVAGGVLRVVDAEIDAYVAEADD